mmetsp:Transcript_11573/g.28021  ORF Transcript_11573/g.28021 Transcript_11573/m.28021 type:complete len:210 (-) Transcript_11573:437-1066(-)
MKAKVPIPAWKMAPTARNPVGLEGAVETRNKKKTPPCWSRTGRVRLTALPKNHSHRVGRRKREAFLAVGALDEKISRSRRKKRAPSTKTTKCPKKKRSPSLKQCLTMMHRYRREGTLVWKKCLSHKKMATARERKKLPLPMAKIVRIRWMAFRMKLTKQSLPKTMIITKTNTIKGGMVKSNMTGDLLVSKESRVEGRRKRRRKKAAMRR